MLDLARAATDVNSILRVRDVSVGPGLDAIAPGLLDELADVAEALWRGDDAAVSGGWNRLEAKGLAVDGVLNEEGRRFRLDLEARTDALTTPAWEAVGAAETRRFCELIEPHHDAFVARIDATAGPRWMPAVRGTGPAMGDDS